MADMIKIVGAKEHNLKMSPLKSPKMNLLFLQECQDPEKVH